MQTKKTGDSTSAGPSAVKQRPRGPASGVSPLLPPPPGAGTRVAAIPKQAPTAGFPAPLGASYSSAQPANIGIIANTSSATHGGDLFVDFGSRTSSAPAQTATGDSLFGNDWAAVTKYVLSFC